MKHLSLLLLGLLLASSVQAQLVSSGQALAMPRQRTNVIVHTGYALSFNDDWLIPNWVSWELTAEEAVGTVPRAGGFYPDPDWKEMQADNNDYRNSGWTRGHMAPAGDMKWSQQAMAESNYLTNICPQAEKLNNGAWRVLEERCRKLSAKFGRIWITCGPIVSSVVPVVIGQNEVVVPEQFFKVLLVQTQHGFEGIGFVFENADVTQSVNTCACSIDDVERLTGLDFFFSLPDETEKLVESTYDLQYWK